jgi:uncharacterized protein (DUF1697 family)
MRRLFAGLGKPIKSLLTPDLGLRNVTMVKTLISLLRAINLAGHKQVAMPVLCDFFTGLRFSEVRTLLQSGNIIFRSEAQNANGLERLLESEAKAQLGLDTDFFVRSARDWKTLVDANPFPNEAKSDPSHLVVMFLKDAPQAKSLEALRASIRGPEIVDLVGRQAYIVYPAGIGRSRLTNALVESKLGVRGTGRNWNTVKKIASLAEV